MLDGILGAFGGDKQKQTELALQFMSKLMSPSEKAMIMLLPAMVNQVIDMNKKPMPKILMDRRNNRVIIVYEFPTEQEAIQYHAIEEKTMQLVKDFKAEIDKVKAKQKAEQEANSKNEQAATKTEN